MSVIGQSAFHETESAEMSDLFIIQMLAVTIVTMDLVAALRVRKASAATARRSLPR